MSFYSKFGIESPRPLDHSLIYALLAYAMTDAALYIETGQSHAPFSWPLFVAMAMLAVGVVLQQTTRYATDGENK